MPDDKPLTTEEALKKLIKETDRPVAKAQAAMAMVVGRANPEPKAAETDEAVRASPPSQSSPTKGEDAWARQVS
jgi:hypothetical protein